MRKKILVVAGNHQQYNDFLRNNRLNPSDFIEIITTENFRGIERGRTVMIVGNHDHHPGFMQRVREMIKVRELKVIEHET